MLAMTLDAGEVKIEPLRIRPRADRHLKARRPLGGLEEAVVGRGLPEAADVPERAWRRGSQVVLLHRLTEPHLEDILTLRQSQNRWSGKANHSC